MRRSHVLLKCERTGALPPAVVSDSMTKSVKSEKTVKSEKGVKSNAQRLVNHGKCCMFVCGSICGQTLCPVRGIGMASWEYGDGQGGACFLLPRL